MKEIKTTLSNFSNQIVDKDKTTISEVSNQNVCVQTNPPLQKKDVFAQTENIDMNHQKKSYILLT